MNGGSFRDRIITFENRGLQDEAERLFIGMSGISPESMEDGQIREASGRVRAAIETGIDTRVICSCYDRDLIHKDGASLWIDGVELRCNAFDQIGEDQIRSVFVCFIKAGEYSLENGNVMDQLLADMWGTAFTDAARARLRTHLGIYLRTRTGTHPRTHQGTGPEGQTCLSDEFGPGFYGMEVTAMRDLAKLADPRKLGIEVLENGILLPVKSCGSIYLEVEDSYVPPDSACADCRGVSVSCSCCNIRQKGKEGS